MLVPAVQLVPCPTPAPPETRRICGIPIDSRTYGRQYALFPGPMQLVLLTLKAAPITLVAESFMLATEAVSKQSLPLEVILYTTIFMRASYLGFSSAPVPYAGQSFTQ